MVMEHSRLPQDPKLAQDILSITSSELHFQIPQDPHSSHQVTQAHPSSLHVSPSVLLSRQAGTPQPSPGHPASSTASSPSYPATSPLSTGSTSSAPSHSASSRRLSLSQALRALNTLLIFLQEHHAAQQQSALLSHGSGAEGERQFWDSQKHPFALGTLDQYAAVQDLRARIIARLRAANNNDAANQTSDHVALNSSNSSNNHSNHLNNINNNNHTTLHHSTPTSTSATAPVPTVPFAAHSSLSNVQQQIPQSHYFSVPPMYSSTTTFTQTHSTSPPSQSASEPHLPFPSRMRSASMDFSSIAAPPSSALYDDLSLFDSLDSGLPGFDYSQHQPQLSQHQNNQSSLYTSRSEFSVSSPSSSSTRRETLPCSAQQNNSTVMSNNYTDPWLAPHGLR